MTFKLTWLFLILLLGLVGLAALVAIIVGLVILLNRKKKHTSDEDTKMKVDS